MPAFLLYRKDDAVVTLTMNQSEQRNPLTGNTAIPAFLTAIERIHGDHVRCVILATNGPSFCAGGNIREIQRQAAPRPSTLHTPTHRRLGCGLTSCNCEPSSQSHKNNI